VAHSSIATSEREPSASSFFSATRRRVVLVPMSIVATRVTTSLDVAEVQELLDVRLNDQLDAAVLLLVLVALVRDVTRDRVELGVASRRPELRVQTAARGLLLGSARLRVADEEEHDLTCAHEREAPVVLERAAVRVRNVVGVSA